MTVWLSRDLVLAIHDEQVARHGGRAALRDADALEKALASVPKLSRPDTAELGATYALAIARNHPFIDGNKRTAYVALELFLALNGIAFPVSDAEATLTTLSMAAGDIDDPTFIAWVRRHATPMTAKNEK